MTTDKIVINVVSLSIAAIVSRTLFLRGYLYSRSEYSKTLDKRAKRSIVIKSIVSYFILSLCIGMVQY